MTAHDSGDVFRVRGFILAGGESSRMGRDKAFIELGGVPLIVRVARLMEPLVGAPTVIGRDERFAQLGLNPFPDDQPGLGPLGAIATALRITAHPWNLILGCDQPFLTTEWLRYLATRTASTSADVVLPESDGGDEPLCAVYHKRCGAVIDSAIARGVRKVTAALAGLRLERIARNESRPFDPDGLLFKNMNSPADYDEALARMNRESNA
jgi:molybdenum cofactor guanylyltransferase